MKKSIVFFALVMIIIIAGCTQQQPQSNQTANITAEKPFLLAADGTKISYNFYDRNGDKAAILLHMLGGSRDDWKEFANMLEMSSIAIDFRGHGGSEGSAEDYSKYILDVDAAKRFLQQKNKTDFIIIGASIGANVALNYAAENSVS